MSHTPTCASCRRGEIDNDEVVGFFDVRDETGQIEIRGWLCDGHRDIFIEDGFQVEQIKEAPTP